MQEYICTNVPYRCQFNATFLVDTSRLANKHDITCDGLGSWKNNSSRKSYFLDFDQSIVEVEKCSANMEMATTYYTHRHHHECKKRIIKCCYKNVSNPTYALVIYDYFENRFTIQDHPHGGSKTKRPYTRIKPSIFDQTKSQLTQSNNPLEIYEFSQQNSGGILASKTDVDSVRNLTITLKGQ